MGYRSDAATHLYSEDAWFESWLGCKLTCLTFYTGFLASQGKRQDTILSRPCPSSPDSLPIHHSSIILPFHLYGPATDGIMQPTKWYHPRPRSIQIHLKFCLLCITISKLTNKLILWNMVSLEKLPATWDIPSWEPTTGPYSNLGASSIKFTSSCVCLWLRPTFSKPVQYNTIQWLGLSGDHLSWDFLTKRFMYSFSRWLQLSFDLKLHRNNIHQTVNILF